jgi:hypothetical protein
MLGCLLTAPASLCQTASAQGPPHSSAVSPANFSGTWVLDTERSWIATPEKERLPSETLAVRQTDTTLIVDGVSEPIPVGRRVRTQRDGSVYETNSTWKDGRLTVTTTVTRRGVVRYAAVVWSLSPSGDELTVMGANLDRDFSRVNEVTISEANTVRVYRRQR